jgi:hypothetical protein
MLRIRSQQGYEALGDEMVETYRGEASKLRGL